MLAFNGLVAAAAVLSGACTALAMPAIDATMNGRALGGFLVALTSPRLPAYLPPMRR